MICASTASGRAQRPHENLQRLRERAFVRTVVFAFAMAALVFLTGCSCAKEVPELSEADIIDGLDVSRYQAMSFYPSDEADDGYTLSSITVDEVTGAGSLYEALNEVGDGIDVEQTISKNEIVSKRYGQTPSDKSDHYESNAPVKIAKCTARLDSARHSASVTIWAVCVYSEGVWRVPLSCPHGIGLS